MSFFEQPLDDATVTEFFAGMRAMCAPHPAPNVVEWGPDIDEATARSNAALPSTHPICDVVRRAGPETADLAREFYVWAKRARLTSKQKKANLKRVQTALLMLADALETLRADRDMIIGDPPLLDTEDFRRRAGMYEPRDWAFTS